MRTNILAPSVGADSKIFASIFVEAAEARFETLVPASGPLVGRHFAVKDLFDVAGMKTGAGNPDWLASHETATATAPAVQRLLDAGMRLVGKTITDELAWSLNGRNVHYGTPPNAKAPGRIPGGSSSGSAAAVAAGLADLALGTDTGGSVRLPASFCGLWGFRPTHNRVPAASTVPLAPSYDVPGWFANNATDLLEGGRLLLNDASFEDAPEPVRLALAEDVWEGAEADARDALGSVLHPLAAEFGTLTTVRLSEDEPLSAWRQSFATLQAAEAWETHGAWIEAYRPRFGPDIGQRFEAASRLDPALLEMARAHRSAITERLSGLFTPGTILVMPTVPGPAPCLDAPYEELEAFRAKAIDGLSPAGHAGLPQVSMPLATVAGAPLGLSLLGPRGSDEQLLLLAARIEELLGYA